MSAVSMYGALVREVVAALPEVPISSLSRTWPADPPLLVNFWVAKRPSAPHSRPITPTTAMMPLLLLSLPSFFAAKLKSA